MLDRATITEKLKESADRYGSDNPQQTKQLISVFGKSKDSELFFGLFRFFFDPSLQENTYIRQQLAGSVLFALKPSCPLQVDGVIYAIPKYWDQSVEEIPWYLCYEFGQEAVKEFLEELVPDVADDLLKKSFETMLFWVKRYDQ